MRWLKYGIYTAFLLLGIYAASMFFVPENKNFTIEREINYPIDKVFPQFNNLQNYSRWYSFFSDNPDLSLDFFSPYEGQGSAMSYQGRKSDASGDLFIRYENPNQTLRYQLFEGDDSTPYLIDLKFKALPGKTKMTWFIHTPRQSFMKRSLNLLTEADFSTGIDKSLRNLSALLSNKMDQEQQRKSVKFDSIMVEDQPGRLLLGVNVSTKNDRNALFKNIVMNHNKVLNFITMDLSKHNDEHGTPVLITDADNFKDKEISYYYGVALPKRIAVADNNFSFKTLNASKTYVIYYRGTYQNRIRAIQNLLLKAKKDTMRSGEIYQTFLEEPSDENDTVLKLSLPVYR